MYIHTISYLHSLKFGIVRGVKYAQICPPYPSGLKGGGRYQHPDDDDDDDDDKFCDNFFTKFGDESNEKFGVNFGDHISTNCAEDFWDTSGDKFVTK